MTVYEAKTGNTLPGVASEKLRRACGRDPEGKALAALDVTQRVDEGGVWYPVDPTWGAKGAIIVWIDS